MASTSVQERIKRLNQLDSGVKPSLTQQPRNLHDHLQSHAISTTASKDKSHVSKTAKLIHKSFSAEGNATSPSPPNRQKQQTYEAETNNIPSNELNSSHTSLSDDENDGEFDAAAAMSYWRSRGKGNNNERKEGRENSATKNAANGANLASVPVTKPAIGGQKSNTDTLQMERDPVVLLSPPRLQHKQAPQSTFNQDIFRSNIQLVRKEVEEAPFDVAAAASTSPTSNGTNYQNAKSSPSAPISSVKSTEAESVLSGETDTSRASTLSTRAKKFLKEKRKNGSILTGRGGVHENSDGSGVETIRSTARSILREKAAKDRLKKKTAAALASKALPVAVGDVDDLGEYTAELKSAGGESKQLEHADFIPVVGKRGELGEDITQIKADIPFDEPSKKNNTGDTFDMSNKDASPDEVKSESIVYSNQLRNFAFASVDKAKENNWDNASQQPNSTNESSRNSADFINVTQQDTTATSDNCSLSTDFTNRSEMNSAVSNDLSQLTSKDSLSSGKSPQAESATHVKNVVEVVEGSLVDTFGALAEDAGCQLLDALESLTNACRGIHDGENVKNNDVPFDEDVAIEVEYVE
ncbi:hypothetical protein ACHAXM_002072 [Skeletonema potamos]